MNLKLNIKILSKYNGKTKFDFWQDLQPNDILKLNLQLKTLYRSRNGLAAPQLLVTKVGMGESEWWSFNDVCRHLEKLDYEEV